MDFQLWAIDAKGGQASVRHGDKWYLVSIDTGWEPTEFEDDKDAHRWARSVPSVSIDRRYATIEEAIPDIREMCLTELDRPDVSFNQVRHLIPSDVKSRVDASPGDADAPPPIDPGHTVVFPASAPELPDIPVSDVLGSELLDADEVMDAANARARVYKVLVQRLNENSIPTGAVIVSSWTTAVVADLPHRWPGPTPSSTALSVWALDAVLQGITCCEHLVFLTDDPEKLGRRLFDGVDVSQFISVVSPRHFASNSDSAGQLGLDVNFSDGGSDGGMEEILCDDLKARVSAFPREAYGHSAAAPDDFISENRLVDLYFRRTLDNLMRDCKIAEDLGITLIPSRLEFPAVKTYERKHNARIVAPATLAFEEMRDEWYRLFQEARAEQIVSLEMPFFFAAAARKFYRPDEMVRATVTLRASRDAKAYRIGIAEAREDVSAFGILRRRRKTTDHIVEMFERATGSLTLRVLALLATLQFGWPLGVGISGATLVKPWGLFRRTPKELQLLDRMFEPAFILPSLTTHLVHKLGITDAAAGEVVKRLDGLQKRRDEGPLPNSGIDSRSQPG